MGRQVFLNKKYSYYLGEQRPLNQIIVGFEADPLPPPSPSPTPTVTPTPTITPTITPTPTLTPTPTITPSATPNLFTQSLPVVVSSGSGDDSDLTGTTFGITYNGTEYFTNNYGGDGGQFTPYYASNCRDNIEEPSPGVVYDFTLTTMASGYTLTSFDWGNGNYGGYDRYKVIVGNPSGGGIWSANTQYYSGTTLLYEIGDNVNTQLTGTTEGCYFDIRIGIATYPVFYVLQDTPLSTESNDEITTEEGYEIFAQT